MIRILRVSQKLIKTAAARFSQKIDNNQQKTVISEEAQRAIWAEAIIKIILKSSWPNSLTQKSLREEILKIPFPAKKFQWTQKVKNEVFQMFDGGIILNPKVFKQGRIQSAKQNQIQFQKQLIKVQKSTENKKFIFCPNYTITKKIFGILLNNQYSRTMIRGGFGLSKSISIILFIQLSNIINSFMYKALKDQEKYKKQLKQIISQGFLKLPIPKIFYWSIDPEDYKTLFNHYLLDILLQQANELEESQKIWIQKSSNGISLDELWNYYPKQIRKKVVIDQINRLASHIRKYQNKEVKNQNDEDYLKVVNFLPFLTQFRRLTFINGFVINSSRTIEERYLYADQSQLSLQFDQHHKLRIVNIEFYKYIEDQGAKIDFLQMLWFEIERNLRLLTDQKTINTIKEQFISAAQTFKFSYFSRFLYCREYLQAFPDKFVEIIKNPKSIRGVLKHFSRYTYKFFQQKLRRFIQKENGIIRQNNLQIMTILVFHCDQIVNQRFARKLKRQEEPAMIVLSLQELEQKYKRQIEPIVSRNQFKQIIPYDENVQNGQIIIPYQPSQFVKYAGEILFPQYKDNFFKMESEFYISDGSLRGKLIEYNLIKAINVGSTFKLPQYLNAQISQKCQSRTIFFNKQVFSEKQTKKRQQKGITYKLQEYFQTLFQRCKSNPNKYIMAVPDDQKSSTKNMSFDFSICSYSIEKDGSQKYKLHTFDVTVKKDLSEKKQTALKLFQLLLKDSQFKRKIEVKHTILGPIKSKQEINKQYVEINMFNYKKIQIENAVKMRFYRFKYMVQLCQILSLQKEQQPKQAKEQKPKQAKEQKPRQKKN